MPVLCPEASVWKGWGEGCASRGAEAAGAGEGLVQAQSSQDAAADCLDSAEKRTVLGHSPALASGLLVVSRTEAAGLSRLRLLERKCKTHLLPPSLPPFLPQTFLSTSSVPDIGQVLWKQS